MKRLPAVHYAVDVFFDTLWRAACRQTTGKITEHLDQVTCKKCLAKIKKGII